jgi:protein SCO1/2
MKGIRRRLVFGFLALAALPLAAENRLPGNDAPTPGTLPTNVRPPQLLGVGIDEHLGNPVDLNLTFIAENGYPVALKDYFHKGRPVILDLVYYNCPMLCTLILNGQADAMRKIPWTPGKEYEVVTISIDPRESFDVSRKKKAVYMGTLDQPAPGGWHFLVDKDNNAKKLAEMIGYHYRYDPRIEQYAHPAAVMVLTPEGRIARYLYGIRFSPRNLRFALAEASEGRSTLTIDRILLYCYHYDPQAGGYVLFATNFMRAGGALTVILFGYIFWRLWRTERERSARYAKDRVKEGLA